MKRLLFLVIALLTALPAHADISYQVAVALNLKNATYVTSYLSNGTTAQNILGINGDDTSLIGSSTVRLAFGSGGGSNATSFTSSTLTFSAASQSIIPGATSLLLRNNANSASNIAIQDGGTINMRGRTMTGTAITTWTDIDAANAPPIITAGADITTNVPFAIAARGAANATPGVMQFFKTRDVADFEGDTIVAANDGLGRFEFWGSTGTNYAKAAQIQVSVSGTPGASNDMGGKIDFLTSPDGSATPASVLLLDQDKTATFAGRIDLSTAAATIKGGATSFQINNNANSLSNLLILDDGTTTLRAALKFSNAASTIVPGATSLQFNNNASSVANLTIADAGAITIRNTIVSSATADIGWTVQTAANQACNTTCTSGCVFGEDTSVVGTFVACTDATADKCLCAGAS